ncbi:mucin-5AC-like, partial [Penaeus japonicus]|uniref:mucin-5AC-like n=1 Tax=Penaeus japonicus TaxID=27405 RepID=UPI001C70FD17
TTTTTTTTTTPEPTTTTTSRTRGFSRTNAGSRFSSRVRGSRFQPSSTTTTTEAPEESTQSRSRFGASRFSSNRNRFSSNRFSTNRFKSQSSTDKPEEEEEVASEGSVDSTTERSGGFRNRFNKPRVSSFRNRGITKKDNEVTERTTERPAPRNRPRLPSRAGLLGSRFRGRGTTAAAGATTEPTEDVEAPVEETIVADVEAEVESSTDTLDAVVATTAASAPARANTRRRPSISRHRFGVRRKPEAGAKKEAEEVPAEGDAPVEETVTQAEAPEAPEAPQAPQAPQGRPARHRKTPPFDSRHHVENKCIATPEMSIRSSHCRKHCTGSIDFEQLTIEVSPLASSIWVASHCKHSDKMPHDDLEQQDIRDHASGNAVTADGNRKTKNGYWEEVTLVKMGATNRGQEESPSHLQRCTNSSHIWCSQIR